MLWNKKQVIFWPSNKTLLFFLGLSKILSFAWQHLNEKGYSDLSAMLSDKTASYGYLWQNYLLSGLKSEAKQLQTQKRNDTSSHQIQVVEGHVGWRASQCAFCSKTMVVLFVSTGLTDWSKGTQIFWLIYWSCFRWNHKINWLRQKKARRIWFVDQSIHENNIR